MLNDREEKPAPRDETVVSLVLGGEGVDDAVFVGLEDETEESALDGEGGGIGGGGLEELLTDRQEEGKEVLDERREDRAVLILVSVPAE